MGGYCCELKCFSPPQTHVDGLACRKCESFGYCKCRCNSYKLVPPTLETLKIYKSKHFYTCCPDMCVKFYLRDIQKYCFKCQKECFCECLLNLCKNRKSWGVEAVNTTPANNNMESLCEQFKNIVTQEFSYM